MLGRGVGYGFIGRSDRQVLLMSPLPKQGREASLIADIIKVLLDKLGREYDSFTSITMQLPEESGSNPITAFILTDGQQFLVKSASTGKATHPPT